MFAVTARRDNAHRLREPWRANLGMERAIPGYGPVKARPLSTAKGRGVGLPKGCAMLLAPAGSLEAAKQAFQAGADAVYVGLRGWSRGGARGEFDRDQLRRCIELAHALGNKVQLADGGSEFEITILLVILLEFSGSGHPRGITQPMGCTLRVLGFRGDPCLSGFGLAGRRVYCFLFMVTQHRAGVTLRRWRKQSQSERAEKWKSALSSSTPSRHGKRIFLRCCLVNT